MHYRPLVLIVDDDPHVRDVIRRFIGPLGFEVAAFGGGAKALASLEASVQPDVALGGLAIDDLARRFEFRGMIGRSPAMHELFDTIARLAPHLRAALVSGETGTGKELVARALHAMGPRASRPFVPYNCSSVVEGLFETEFFGHTRGAFTGAVTAKAGLFDAAQGGTLFLDEIGELAPPLQAKLLRVIEHGEVQRVGATVPHRVDVCVVAATNRLLESFELR